MRACVLSFIKPLLHDTTVLLYIINTVFNENDRPSNLKGWERFQRVLNEFFEEIAKLHELLTLEEVGINSTKIFTNLRVLWNSPGSYRAFKCLSLFQRPRLFSLLREEINNGASLIWNVFYTNSCVNSRPMRRTSHIVHELLYLYGLTDGERDEYMKIYVRELQMAMTRKET